MGVSKSIIWCSQFRFLRKCIFLFWKFTCWFRKFWKETIGGGGFSNNLCIFWMWYLVDVNCLFCHNMNMMELHYQVPDLFILANTVFLIFKSFFPWNVHCIFFRKFISLPWKFPQEIMLQECWKSVDWENVHSLFVLKFLWRSKKTAVACICNMRVLCRN